MILPFWECEVSTPASPSKRAIRRPENYWRAVLASIWERLICQTPSPTPKLLNKKGHGMALRARLDLLRILKTETADEARLRSLENKKAFKGKRAADRHGGTGDQPPRRSRINAEAVLPHPTLSGDKK
jgi:hypothetical protein